VNTGLDNVIEGIERLKGEPFTKTSVKCEEAL